MKYSLCEQYWNKYDSFENFKDSVMFICMKHAKYNDSVQNVKYDCIRLSYLSYSQT